ncbi:tetratricopeptide repeat protein [Pseudoxanthomonas koreensis]|uniref:tetratricopeptide repeat protein n=1 Tax=Pseudoxanthomonas koreensis TaxID=266061 RepID=UPI001391892E|nr:tetratricopeptide repeat protein [Pseudoxanthomonas koreensis]KAF1693584.1 adenylate cyclase [Pseudoxanthomonas koreensis]
MHDQILQALRRDAADEAVRLAREWLAAAPDDAQAYRWLATAQRQQGEADAALDNISRAIALDPENADLHLERAGLLLGMRQIGEAEADLARSTGLDPNQFQAYVARAHLALGRGDLDEAQRLSRTAARVSPDDPQLAAIDGIVALRRGDADGALAMLAAAARRLPDDPRLLHALGFAYLAKGHWAFAEQAFRRVMEMMPATAGLQVLIAQLALRQDRPRDAFNAMDTVLANPATDTPAMRRVAGEMRLQAGFPERGLPYLKQALAASPGDPHTLRALLAAWERLGAFDEARDTLEAALATAPAEHALWQARLALEAAGSEPAGEVARRWGEAMPEHVPALEVLMELHDKAGESDAAEALARRIAALEPYRPSAVRRLSEALLLHDPDQAVAYVEDLLASASERERLALQHWLGSVQDRAGRPADALRTWTALNAGQVGERLPLPPRTVGELKWPAMGQLPAAETVAGGPVLVWGAPGSGVERLIAVLDHASPYLRGDRFGMNTPPDAFQKYTSVADLLDGKLDPAAMVAEWRALLPRRGLPDQRVIDWLGWWDNAFLLALRPHLPEGRLLVALRDPRDMLLDWIAYGAALPLAVETPEKAAEWLAGVLEQVADLAERDLYPHGVIRLDGIEADADAVAQAVRSMFADPRIPTPPTVGVARLPAGHWRRYAEALAGPFATLAPVVARLGYPET